MFQNHYSLWFNGSHNIIILFQDSDTSGIIISHRSLSTFPLCQSFSKVKTKTVNMVFIQKELQIPLDKRPYQLRFMIKIMEHAIRMRSIHIKPWVVFRCLIICPFPVEFSKWHASRGMIIYNIKNHSQSSGMTFINKPLIHIFCPIRFIQSKIETRIVSPTVIPIKFLYRHKFNGIHP